MGEVMTRLYRAGVLDAEGFAVEDVSEHLAIPNAVVWVDLCRPSREELYQLAGELGLHELAVEDAFEPHQRPKLDRYASHLFLSCHAVRVDTGAGNLEQTEVNAFVNERWLVTVRKSDRFPLEPVLHRLERSPDLAANGVRFMLYGLLDVVVDGYFDAIQTFDDYYETVSERVFSEQPLDPSQQRHWFDMRRAMVSFHRLAVPLRETVSSLMRREQAAPTEPLYPYYQDVYDHILRVCEASDSLRDLVGTIVEANLSLRDYRQNLIVKKVSSWAAIIAVPTLVTGFYGMNVPYPGSGDHVGVVVSSAIMVGAGTALYVSFRRRDWL